MLTTVGYTAALCTGVIGSESLQYQPVGTDIADIQLKLKHNKESERSRSLALCLTLPELPLR